MTKKMLCWWIGFIHHVSAILDLDTGHGPISVLPDYTDVTLGDLPDFARRSVSQARIKNMRPSIDDRWAKLEEETKDTELWPFYSIPHAKLIALKNSRPVAPLFPRLGVRDDVLARGLKNLADGERGHLTRLFASGVEDGFTTKRVSRGQGGEKKSPKKRTGRKKAKDSLTSAPSHTEPDEGMFVLISIKLFFFSFNNRHLVCASDFEPSPEYSDGDGIEGDAVDDDDYTDDEVDEVEDDEVDEVEDGEVEDDDILVEPLDGTSGLQDIEDVHSADSANLPSPPEGRDVQMSTDTRSDVDPPPTTVTPLPGSSNLHDGWTLSFSDSFIAVRLSLSFS